MEKHTENNEKGGKERVKRRFLQRMNLSFHKTFFKKKKNTQKRQIKIQNKDFSKTLKKGGKENENKKKKKKREKL